MSADEEPVNLCNRQEQIYRKLELLWKDFVKIAKHEISDEQINNFDTKISVLFKEFKNNHNNIIISKCSDDHYEEVVVEMIVLLRDNFLKAIDDASSNKNINELREFYDLVEKQIEFEEKIENLLKDNEKWASVKLVLAELFSKFDENDHKISSLSQDKSIYESIILSNINSLREDYQVKLNSVEIDKKEEDPAEISEEVIEIDENDLNGSDSEPEDDERVNSFKEEPANSTEHEGADKTSPTEMGIPRTEESSFTNVSNFTNISIQSVDVKNIQDFLARNQHMCRICLKTKSRELLTSLNSLSEIGDNIASLVEYCTGLDVNQDKHLPQNICLECLDSMQESFKIKKMTLESNSKIKQRFYNVLENIGVSEHNDTPETHDDSFEMADEKPSEENEETAETIAETKDPPKEEMGVDLSNEKPLEKSVAKTSKCTQCDASFATDRGLNMHVHRMHEKDPHSSESSKLKVEKDSHPSEYRFRKKEFKCFCKQKIPSINEAFDHIKEHLEKDEVFRCKKCKFVSKSHFSILYHVQGHQEKYNKKCSICNKVFTSKVVFWNHRRKHNPDSALTVRERVPLNCTICSTKHNTITAMKEHLKSNHFKDGKFNCPFCKGLSTISPITAYDHLKYCKNNFICKPCNKQFASRNKLTRHLYNHSLRVGYDCEYCGKTVFRKNNLQKHVKTAHGREVTKYIESKNQN